MMHPLPHNAALLVIDVPRDPRGALRGKRNNPTMEQNIARLVEAWRASGRAVLEVAHDPRWPGAPVHYSAFVGTSLESELVRRGMGTLVLTGLATDRCVSTTARLAANLGFATYVVADATATFERLGPDGHCHAAAAVHAIALAELNGEFATIVDTAAVLEALRPGGPRSPTPTADVDTASLQSV